MIPVNEPLLNGNEKKYLSECIDGGWVSSEGPFVRRFEDEFSKRVNRRYGIAVCNGSAALDVAISALGIGAGDEVLMPTFTIISCAAAVVRAGAVPVIIDADPVNWNMRTDLIESHVTARTRAIMAVHIYGLPVDMTPLTAVAAKYRLKVIEDAAEAIGQNYNGNPCGSFGDISTFSFYANKHVTTGEGGMVLTNDEALADRCRHLRDLCFGKDNRFKHYSLGWNYRMSNLQAAVGVAQIERLGATVSKKRQIGRWYDELLEDIPVERAPATMAYADNLWWVYGIVLPIDGPDARQVMKLLGDRGVATRPFFWPMHEQPVLLAMGLFKDTSCPVAERIARRGFYIPCGVALTRDQAEEVAINLREIICG